MYQLLQYLKFLCTATNQHGVHSPFVYDLVTQCFYAKTDKDIASQLKAYRNALLSKTETLTITDYGAGSKRYRTNQRSVKQIVRTSGTSMKRARFMFRIVNYLKPKHILELGTSLGIATQAMALGNPEAHIVSIEGCPHISNTAKQQLDQFQMHGVNLKSGAFESHLPTLKNQQWDLVFFDGNHQKAATLQYFEQLLPTAHNGTVFIFDDIYWSKAMTEAWNMMAQHPKVSVTVDTFHWGLVFFKKELTKENFKIRV